MDESPGSRLEKGVDIERIMHIYSKTILKYKEKNTALSKYSYVVRTGVSMKSLKDSMTSYCQSVSMFTSDVGEGDRS